MKDLFVLGGTQSDFAQKLAWDSGDPIAGLLANVVDGALDDARVGAEAIDAVHVGNFVGERLFDQGLLGGVLAESIPALAGNPIARHEAACASGSVAAFAAFAELLAGLSECALVVGLEAMRHVPGRVAAADLAVAARPDEVRAAEGRPYWPHAFDRVGEVYRARGRLERAHLGALSAQAFESAKRNPNAQTRKWTFGERAFTDDDDDNPRVTGEIRRHDCAQITDGAAAIVVANETFATTWAASRGLSLSSLPRVMGFAQRTARITLAGKLEESRSAQEVLFPHVRGALDDALAAAQLPSVADGAWRALDVVETHDCFTTSFAMAIDHLGLTAPYESWRAIEEGVVRPDGALPFNPSGGLIGSGHPVGATGVRMILDQARQLSARAGAYQVEGAKRALCLNLGGSATTTAVTVLGVSDDA